MPGIREYESSRPPRRSLRPRQDKNYSEHLDIIAFSDEEPKTNGYYNHSDSDSDLGEMPPLPTIKVILHFYFLFYSFLSHSIKHIIYCR